MYHIHPYFYNPNLVKYSKNICIFAIMKGDVTGQDFESAKG